MNTRNIRRRKVARSVALNALAAFSAGGFVFSWVQQASGTAYTWSGGNTTNGNWSYGTNWVGNATPANNGTSSLIFSGSTRLSNTVDTAWNIAGLSFASGSGNFTLGGNSTLTLGNGGIVNNSTGNQTITDGPIVLSASQTWLAASGNLTISPSGNITLGNYTLTIDGTYNTTINNNTGAELTGTGGLIKNGNGTLLLTGINSNNYGDTTVNRGKLELNGAGYPLSVGNLTVGNGTGLPGSAIVQWDQSAEVLGGSVNLIVNADGWVNLNSYEESITTLQMTGGNVTTGAGIIYLVGNLTTKANSTAATISGNLNLYNPLTFNVAQGGGAIDLDVSAAISNSSLVC